MTYFTPRYRRLLRLMGRSKGPEARTDRGTSGGAGGKKDEDVIDAEYEVKE